MTDLRPASLSIDLDDKWSYLKTHGDAEWSSLPSFLPVVVPRMLDLLSETGLRATFFVVGLDALQDDRRELLRSIVEAGHEIGNHSHVHDPWLHRYPPDRAHAEIHQAHEAISEATGTTPIGFRGPGYTLSRPTLEALQGLGYRYDASTLPTWIGPLARRYYERTTADQEPGAERSALFGTFRDGLQPLRPFRWALPRGDLLEIPVTTMPLTRLPIHFTYLLFLAARSPRAARAYLRTAVRLCVVRRIQPSLILHPPEFLAPTDPERRGLDFLPGVDVDHGLKRALLIDSLAIVGRAFRISTLADHCAQIEQQPVEIRRMPLSTSAT